MNKYINKLLYTEQRNYLSGPHVRVGSDIKYFQEQTE